MEKEKNSIDDLFREVLHDHEITPSEHAKENFLKEIPEMKKEDRFRRGLFFFIFLAIFIIAGGIAIYFLTDRSAGIENADMNSGAINQVKEPATQTDSHLSSSNNNSNANETNPPSVKSNKNTISSGKIQNTTGNSAKKELNSQTATNPLNGDDKNANREHDSLQQGEMSGQTLQLITAENKDSGSYSPAAGQLADTSLLLQMLILDSVVTLPPANPAGNTKKQKQEREGYFSLSIHYTPEWMFNTLENVKYVNNFGAEGTFTYGNYSVRTGLGLSITTGTNEIAVEYNDYLGSYNKLDSMSFAWDGVIQDFIPTYYMKSQNVYDSLMKLDHLKVMKRYTYLQIPLILGYDFLRSGRFSLGFRTGPLLSILLSSKQLSEEYDPGQKKVISVNNITPEQVSLNWQFMAGINASAVLSKNLGFEVEPMAKYYFNSVYEKSEITEKPWSIGFRAAFIIKLK